MRHALSPPRAEDVDAAARAEGDKLGELLAEPRRALDPETRPGEVKHVARERGGPAKGELQPCAGGSVHTSGGWIR